jgi:F-type H+-transporting ATPase subunit gamma
MGRRREVEGRIEALGEIHGIMESMKKLAMIEAHKLGGYHLTQQRVVDAISRALDAVLSHHAIPAAEADAPVYLLLGSDRGFCGGYNEQLVELLAQQPGHETAPKIGVGRRLVDPLQRRYPEAQCLPGAAVADEAGGVLSTVVEVLNRLRLERGPLRLEVIRFRPDNQGPLCQPALPPSPPSAGQGLPPLINLPPRQLVGQLLEHYLFALTHAWFFAALIAENQQRMQHLEQAGDHLQHQVEELGKRRNMLRQEEIIEEIEVILLSSEAVGAPGAAL